MNVVRSHPFSGLSFPVCYSSLPLGALCGSKTTRVMGSLCKGVAGRDDARGQVEVVRWPTEGSTGRGGDLGSPPAASTRAVPPGLQGNSGPSDPQKKERRELWPCALTAQSDPALSRVARVDRLPPCRRWGGNTSPGGQQLGTCRGISALGSGDWLEGLGPE